MTLGGGRMRYSDVADSNGSSATAPSRPCSFRPATLPGQPGLLELDLDPSDVLPPMKSGRADLGPIVR